MATSAVHYRERFLQSKGAHTDIADHRHRTGITELVVSPFCSYSLDIKSDLISSCQDSLNSDSMKGQRINFY